MTDTFDPVTLTDTRDDLAAYRLEQYNDPTNADDDVAAIVANEIRTLINWASVTTADVGDIDDVRAPHVWNVGRETTDHRPDQYRAPDQYRESVTAVRTVKRGKKGSSVTVTRHGRSLVGGHTADVQAVGRIPAAVVRDAIDRTRERSSTGLADGIALARLATLLYDIPDLIGGDVTSWSEVIPATDENGRPMDPRDIAAHLDHPVGLSGGLSPTLDRAVGPEYRTADDDPRSFPRAWTTGATSLSWPDRRRIVRVRRRKNETDRETVVRSDQNGRGTLWAHVTELWAPGPDGRAFIGHTGYERPMTVRERRARRARLTDGRVELDQSSDLADGLAGAIAERVDAGLSGRWEWEHGDDHGTFTLSRSGRLNVNGAGYRVSGARTIEGVRAQLRAQSRQ
jgi:hypothetical protein